MQNSFRTPPAHILVKWPRRKRFSTMGFLPPSGPNVGGTGKARRSRVTSALSVRGGPRDRVVLERSALAGGTRAEQHSRPATRFFRPGRPRDHMWITLSEAHSRASENDRQHARISGHTLWARTDVDARAVEPLAETLDEVAVKVRLAMSGPASTAAPDIEPARGTLTKSKSEPVTRRGGVSSPARAGTPA